MAVADDLPAVTVRAGDRLAAALVELVENAIEHGAPPRRVEADAGGGWVTVRVLDRGPGVPEGERAVVTGAREISQLEHGSGLGLWVVRWAVDACGGEFDISARADGGTAATLRFPVE
ncbi:MAG: sensor histidine kinase [Halobacteriaceae archaeon]